MKYKDERRRLEQEGFSLTPTPRFTPSELVKYRTWCNEGAAIMIDDCVIEGKTSGWIGEMWFRQHDLTPTFIARCPACGDCTSRY